MLSIPIRNRSTGTSVGQLTLPLFCVDHMRMTSPEMNLQTLKQHVESKCGPVSAMYIGGPLTGLTCDQLTAPGVVIEVDTN
jgi:hypothetical protein